MQTVNTIANSPSVEPSTIAWVLSVAGGTAEGGILRAGDVDNSDTIDLVTATVNKGDLVTATVDKGTDVIVLDTGITGVRIIQDKLALSINTNLAL